eukprot:4387940-Pyramimonas_sp.AAC.1
MARSVQNRTQCPERPQDPNLFGFARVDKSHAQVHNPFETVHVIYPERKRPRGSTPITDLPTGPPPLVATPL